MNRDQKFFDMYSLVIGVLAIIALLIFVGAMKLSDMTQGIYTAETAEYQAEVADRLRPFGQVYLPGEEASAGEPVVEEAQQPDPVETMMSGPQVYNSACLVCHGAGVGGAPVIGDVDVWSPRIAAATRNGSPATCWSSPRMPTRRVCGTRTANRWICPATAWTP